jgi:tetratricopeptide (TPR) repeat protein
MEKGAILASCARNCSVCCGIAAVAQVGVNDKLCHYCHMRPLILISLSLLMLSACSSNPALQTAAEPQAPAVSAGTDSDAETPDADADSKPTPEPEPPAAVQRPFPDASFYPLLVAEFALRRRDYELALQNYLEQAEILRDSGISAHTTRLAQFMQREKAATTSALLWVELDPDNLEARLTLASLLARQGRSLEALPHMEFIVRAGGNPNFTALARGFEDLDPPLQLSLFNTIQGLLVDYPDNTQLRICKVLMLEELGKTERALATLQPVFDIDASQPQAVVLDAKLRLDLGQKREAYDRIEAVLLQEPENHRLRMQYARLLTRTDLEAAEYQFQVLVDQAPDEPDLLFSLALIQREMEDLDGARENLTRLLDLNARTDEAHYYLGRTAEEQQRYEDALTHYIQVQPGRDFGAATERAAALLLASGQIAELSTYFDHLRKRYPQLSERLFAIEADKLSSRNHLAESVQLLDRGLQEFPLSTTLRYSRSMLYERQGNLSLAEQDLRDILAREPDNATALNALGYTLTNHSDRYAEAADFIARALALSPDEPAILDSMGWIKYRLGEYDEALVYLQRAYRVFPDPEVAAHLGEVLWAAGEQKAAITVWQQALARSPQHVILLETIQRLGVEPAED